ncbi:MAG: radical SAM protein, partial [Thermoplasma sp.]
MRVIEIEVKTALQKSGLRELDYSLNPYLGCMHRCLYCYAMDMTKDTRASSDWGSTVIAKRNIIEVLRREIPYRRRGIVGISTITDPYQPVEFRYRLTRQAVGILLKEGFRVSIQ